MTRRAVIIGTIVAIGFFIYMIFGGWFMGGDSDVECLPYAECERAR